MSEVNTVIQSNFMRSYKVAVKRIQEYNQLPPSTKDVIARLSDGMSIGLLEDQEG